MKPVCMIFGAGDYYEAWPVHPRPGDYVIAADAGYIELEKRHIPIDEVIGDFDSTGFMPNHPNTIRLPVEKDDTDMLFALRRGLEKGFDEFWLFGGTGGRLDHTLANLQCLAWLARQGKRGFLCGDGCVLTAVHDGTLNLGALDKGTVSVFSLGDSARGVSLRGLKYELDRAVMTNDFPIGVSNEMIGKPVQISVEHGTLIVCFPQEAAIL